MKLQFRILFWWLISLTDTDGGGRLFLWESLLEFIQPLFQQTLISISLVPGTMPEARAKQTGSGKASTVKITQHLPLKSISWQKFWLQKSFSSDDFSILFLPYETFICLLILSLKSCDGKRMKYREKKKTRKLLTKICGSFIR